MAVGINEKLNEAYVTALGADYGDINTNEQALFHTILGTSGADSRNNLAWAAIESYMGVTYPDVTVAYSAWITEVLANGVSLTVDPAEWFTSGVGDAFILTPDYQNMYQDTGGASPVTADSQTVARIDPLAGVGSGHVYTNASSAIDALTRTYTGAYWPFSNGHVQNSTPDWYSTWTAGFNMRLDNIASPIDDLFMERNGATPRAIAGIDGSENVRIFDGAGTAKQVVGYPLARYAFNAIVLRADGTNFDIWMNGTNVLSTTGTAYANDFALNTRIGSTNMRQYQFMNRLMFNTQVALSDSQCVDICTWLAESD